MDGDSEGEADDHAAGVGFYGLEDEVADFGEFLYAAVDAVDLGGVEAKDGGVEIDVVAAGELGVEAGAEFEQGRDAAIDCGFAFSWGKDAGDDLKEGAFAGTVFADDAECLSLIDFKGDILQGPEVLMAFEAVESDEFLEALRRRAVDWIALADALEGDEAHG